MLKPLVLFLLLLSSLCSADDHIEISNLSIKFFHNKNSSVTIYGDITNPNEQLDYLLNIEVIDHPEAIVTINKTVIEQNIARIIQIDRLAIPAHTTVNLKPLGIYLIMNHLSKEVFQTNNFKVKFIFAQTEIIKEISLP